MTDIYFGTKDTVVWSLMSIPFFCFGSEGWCVRANIYVRAQVFGIPLLCLCLPCRHYCRCRATEPSDVACGYPSMLRKAFLSRSTVRSKRHTCTGIWRDNFFLVFWNLGNILGIYPPLCDPFYCGVTSVRPRCQRVRVGQRA